MAVIFKVSEKKWANWGLDPVLYDTIVSKGYQPSWVGKHISLIDVDGYQWGCAQLDSGELSGLADLQFKVKFKELTGVTWTKAMAGALHTKSVVDLGPKFSQQKPKPPLKNAQHVDPVMAGKELNLTTATEVGVQVKGTDSIYTVCVVSPECNIAYRYVDGKLSIRAERFTPEAHKRLIEWGLHPKTGVRPYASTHVSATKDQIAKTIGSLVGFTLSQPPEKILSWDKMK